MQQEIDNLVKAMQAVIGEGTVLSCQAERTDTAALRRLLTEVEVNNANLLTLGIIANYLIKRWLWEIITAEMRGLKLTPDRTGVYGLQFHFTTVADLTTDDGEEAFYDEVTITHLDQQGAVVNPKESVATAIENKAGDFHLDMLWVHGPIWRWESESKTVGTKWE